MKGDYVDWVKKYNEWMHQPDLDARLKKELLLIEKESEKEDRFYDYLAFGTGGIRGQLGVGTNRMNIYTIKRTAKGLAQFIADQGVEAMKAGVVIGYDNRYQSREFAEWTARVLASAGVHVSLMARMCPTPELAFLVRELHTFAGVMITASHNPGDYNGFKVYGNDGGQITLEMAGELSKLLSAIDDELTIKADSLISYILAGDVDLLDEQADALYLKCLAEVSQNKELAKQAGSQLSILYTPLHGTGEALITKGLAHAGFTHLTVLASQADGDPGFSTTTFPNPEVRTAFDLSVETAVSDGAELILGTDPDSDRLGVVLMENKVPVYLNGNQVGVLLLSYLIEEAVRQRKDLSDYFIAKTIVTSDLGKKLAEKYQLEVRETLTGFKYIGEQIKVAEKEGSKNFLFGYEESNGYLIKPFVRDKDAIQAALLMAELSLACKQNDLTLTQKLEQIYEEFGFFLEELDTIEFPGKIGLQKMSDLISLIRQTPIMEIGHKKVLIKEDYLTGDKLFMATGRTERLELPKSDVIKFVFQDDSWICIRPSGTEPKCKIYYSTCAGSYEESSTDMLAMKQSFQSLINDLNREPVYQTL